MFVDKWEYLPRACNGARLVRCPACRRILSDSDIGMVRRHCPNCGAKNEFEETAESSTPPHGDGALGALVPDERRASGP